MNAEIGPKTKTGTEAWADFVLDLHSTSSHMGLSLVMNGTHDGMARRVAKYLKDTVASDLKVLGVFGSNVRDAQGFSHCGSRSTADRTRLHNGRVGVGRLYWVQRRLH